MIKIPGPGAAKAKVIPWHLQAKTMRLCPLPPYSGSLVWKQPGGSLTMGWMRLSEGGGVLLHGAYSHNKH